MKRSKLAMTVSLTLLVTVLGGGVVNAKGTHHTDAQNPMRAGDPMSTQNTQFKGLKSPHSSRKEAAKRLKVLHQQKHQQKLHDWAKSHQGHKFSGGAK